MVPLFFRWPILSRLASVMEASSADPISLPLLCWRSLWRSVTTQSPSSFMSSDSISPLLLHLLSLLAEALLWLWERLPRSWETQEYPSVLHITCHNIFNSNSSCVFLWEPLASLSPDNTVRGWSDNGSHPSLQKQLFSKALPTAGFSILLNPLPMVSGLRLEFEGLGFSLHG